MTEITDTIPGPPYPGVYQHYKGDLYVVHRIVSDSTNHESPNTYNSSKAMVLYESLKTEEWHVRSVFEFLQQVHEDGSVCGGCDGSVPRFKLLDMTNYEAWRMVNEIIKRQNL